MRKSIVLKYYDGSMQAVADALDITYQAVWDWKEIIPEGAAYKLESVTGGGLRVDAKLYRKSSSHSRRASASASA